jgi:erythromycin esterase
MGLGVSEENGVGQPEPGTLEARLAEKGRAMFIPTHHGEGMARAEIEALPKRSGSTLNPTYSRLSAQSFIDFDWVVFLGSTTYPRGARPLTDWNSG